MLKHKLLITFFVVLLSLCKDSLDNNSFSLQANLTNVTEGTLFMLKSWDSNTKIDSAYLTNGSLYLQGQLNQHYPEKLFLYATDAKSQEFIYTNIISGNEQLTLSADKKDFPWNIDISGSIHQDQAEIFNQIEYQRQSISKALKETYEFDPSMLTDKLEMASDSLDEVMVELIKQNFNSYAALNSFKYYKNMFSNEDLISLYATLDSDLKKTKSGKAIKLQSEYSFPDVGDHYYDYEALNQHGETISLSGIKAKYILLHFSSAACYYSQQSLPELKLLHKAHQHDLEIISISEDESKEDWLQTISRDSIPWSYLWDGQGSFGEAVIKYWQVGTPNYVLISPEKVILERWFGYGEGIIEEKIKKHLIN